MSNFFRSKIIQEEMQDIFEKLIDKQEIMWTRLSLSDDPEAKQMRDKILVTSAAMGFKEVNMNTIFSNMRKTLENLSEKLHT